MRKRKKNRKNYNLIIVGILIIICILLIIIFNNNSNTLINNYGELYKFNKNGYDDKKYDIGSNEYFLYKTNQIFYYLYNNTNIDENITYDTIDLDNDFVSYFTNILYSNGNRACYSREMINSMTFYLLGRGIKIDNNSKYYDINKKYICFNKFNYKYNNLIDNIVVSDNNNQKIVTFSLRSTSGKYTFIYKYDNSYNTYYLFKYSFKVDYNKDNYVYNEETKEYVLVGQD